MHTKKLALLGAVVLATGAAAVGAAAPAQAAPGTFYGYHQTRAECIAAGEAGTTDGWWHRYWCLPYGSIWALYVD